MITQKKLFHYNPDTGIFVCAFHVRSSTRQIGDIVGYKRQNGYIEITVSRKHYLAHRLAFLYMTGVMPNTGIDHKDGNPSNNKWVNLRIATISQNNAIARIRKHNKSGYKGVSERKGKNRVKKWIAKIVTNWKSILIGYYETREAARAYDKAALKYHGEYAYLNFKDSK